MPRWCWTMPTPRPSPKPCSGVPPGTPARCALRSSASTCTKACSNAPSPHWSPGRNVPALAIAEALFWGAFWNTGQVCFAIKRLYVHESLCERTLAALVARAQRTRIGHGLEPGTELGPLTTRQQLERVEALVADAVANGATLHSGGHRLAGPGFFYAPTFVTGVGAGVALVDEEQFGPVLPLIPFNDDDQAVALANSSPYGLGASVWTADTTRGEALARRLDVGLAWVNQHLDIQPGAPKGGYKWSGLG